MFPAILLRLPCHTCPDASAAGSPWPFQMVLVICLRSSTVAAALLSRCTKHDEKSIRVPEGNSFLGQEGKQLQRVSGLKQIWAGRSMLLTFFQRICLCCLVSGVAEWSWVGIEQLILDVGIKEMFLPMPLSLSRFTVSIGIGVRSSD